MIDYVEILTLLFRLQQSEVDADLERAKAKVLQNADERYEGRDPGEEKTSETRAVDLHRRLVRAYALQFSPNLLEDVALYNASMAAYSTAENAAMAGHGEGRLPQILEEIAAIEKREGLADDEYFELGDGPADYQALQEEYDRESEKITDAIFRTMLRRYRMDAIADLHENNRMLYDVQMEVGRRFLNGSEPEQPFGEWNSFEEFAEAELLEKYGRKAFDVLRARLKEAGLRGD